MLWHECRSRVKPTTIRMVLGLLRPTAGHVYMFGRDNTTHLATNLFRLGALIEMPVFYPYLSGLDNLRTLAARSGMQLGNAQHNGVIFVHTPTSHSAEIVALLAQQRLFPTELYHYEATLEEFFLDVTTPSKIGASDMVQDAR